MSKDIRLQHVLKPAGRSLRLLLVYAEHVGEEVAYGQVATFHLPGDLGAFFGERSVTIARMRYEPQAHQVLQSPGDRRAGYVQVHRDLTDSGNAGSALQLEDRLQVILLTCAQDLGLHRDIPAV